MYISNFDTFYTNNIDNNTNYSVMKMFEYGGYKQSHIWDICISHSELVNLHNYLDTYFPMYLI
jgi:hypothetical protein